MNCPSCKGDKRGIVFANKEESYSAHTQEMQPCKTCGGSGEVTQESYEWIIAGTTAKEQIRYLASDAVTPEEDK